MDSAQFLPVRVAVFVGTRPEVIKMAPLISRLRDDKSFELLVISSGQHSSLLSESLAEFQLTPDVSLDVFQSGQDLASITSKVLLRTSDALREVEIDVALVHGDTTTAVSSALACFYLGIPIGHVEAGLRTYDLSSPFPEELNRQVIARVATVNFCPDTVAADNLRREGVKEDSIVVTGNTVVDSLLLAKNLLQGDPKATQIVRTLSGEEREIQDLSKIVLMTFHRRENLDSLQDTFRSLRHTFSEIDDIEFIFPVHPNPLVREAAMRELASVPEVILVEPLQYLEFVNLLSNALLVLTDSGGVQEEAITLGVPVVVFRKNSERLGDSDHHLAQLADSDEEKLRESLKAIVASPRTSPRSLSTRFGDGNASERIVQALLREFGEG